MMTESISVVSRDQGGGRRLTAKSHKEIWLSDVAILHARGYTSTCICQISLNYIHLRWAHLIECQLYINNYLLK